MKENLLITLFLCIFAKWIGGLSTPTDKGNPTALPLCYLLESLNVGNEMGRFLTLTTKDFIERARKVHGDKYDYSKVNYKNAHTNIEIICPIHGSFFQMPHKHLCGHGCPRCAFRYNFTKEDFINEAQKIHGHRYDYSKVVFEKLTKKVTIICPIHGEFKQYGHIHLNGGGCPFCAHEYVIDICRITKDEWIERANIIHNNKYDYSKVEYKKLSDKVQIMCPTHGLFEQAANSHIHGHGCPACKRSLGEEKIAEILNKYNIQYKQQFVFKNDCSTLFCENKIFKVDFFLENKIAIEYNGAQHYKSMKYFGGKNAFENQKERDIALCQYCKEHKIKLIEIPYWDYDNIETILKKELKIK